MGAASLSGWWFWFGQYTLAPRFDYLLISVNQEPQKILPGETLSLHPGDKVKILKISTNIPLSHNVRLTATDLDVEAIRYQELWFAELLPGGNFFDHYTFRIGIKYRNHDLGHVDLQVRPYAEDWMEKANRIIDLKKRLDFLEKAHQLLPKDGQIRGRLLSEYRHQKKWNKAARMLEKMAGKKPGRDVLNELLEVYRARDSKDGVISVLKRLVDLNPDDLETRGRLAKALENKGKYKEAIKEYAILLEGIAEGDRLGLHKHLGYLYTKTGQVKEAISHYARAAYLDEKDANVFYNLSYLHEKIGEKKKAELFLVKAIKREPKDVENRLKLASGLIKRKKMKEAEAYLKEALQENPKSINALLLLSQVAEKQGEKGKLRKTYETILSLDPSNETVTYNLGVLEYETGHVEASLRYLNTYLKMHPKDQGVHAMLFDIHKGRKDRKNALKEALILVNIAPKEIDPYYFIFDDLKSRNDYDKMIPIMAAGLKAGIRETVLREYLVVAYLKTGNEKSAMGQMEAILKQRPKDIDLLLHLAKLREKNGDLPGALEAYGRVTSLSPGHEEAEEAYLRLRLKRLEDEGAK
ncbi:MAG: tetratricopeptide repeat protein [Deltaproteobacteria bacterium]|nr:tetratricopeptide repeat protein [Deltaproteobacteria bacterium]